MSRRLERPSDPNDGAIFRIGVTLGFIALIISQIMGVPDTYALIIFCAVIISTVVIGTASLMFGNFTVLQPLTELLRLEQQKVREPRRSIIIGSEPPTEVTASFTISVSCPKCGTRIST
jgi:hypothetical protein